MSDSIEETDADFPPTARAFLKAFYTAKGANTDKEKMAAIRQGYQLYNADAYGHENELKLLEFYILTTRGII